MAETKQVTFKGKKDMVEGLKSRYDLVSEKKMKDGDVQAVFNVKIDRSKGGQRPQAKPVSQVEVEGNEAMIRGYQMRGYKLVGRRGSVAILER